MLNNPEISYITVGSSSPISVPSWLQKTKMRQERRRYERFPLILTARRTDAHDDPVVLDILELGVGGCLTECFPEARAGYKFRLEIPLVEKGWLRLNCKVRYRFAAVGLGIEFLDITDEEKESVAEIIMNYWWHQDLPPDAVFAPPASTDNPRKLEFA